MNEVEKQVVQLLTEIRDGQREDAAYRRRAIDESVVFQKRAVKLQRTALTILVVLTLAAIVVIAMLLKRVWP